MNTNSFAVKMAVLLLAVSFCLGGCSDSDDEDNSDVRRDIFVTLENPSFNLDPIHILSPGESLSPENRLVPGEFREVFIGSVMDGELIVFRAGRNGVICIEVACGPDLEQDFFMVWWDDLDGELVCDEGFKTSVIRSKSVCPL